jgi:heme-degrading monooxygenase HmoA
MFIVIWEYAVKPDKTAEFEKEYGSAGSWAAFFQEGEGLLSTELCKDPSQRNRYITIDRWISKDAYEDFKLEFSEQYEALDKRLSALTDKETEVGTFERL